MNVDTAIQKMLFTKPEQYIAATACLASERPALAIAHYQNMYRWSVAECNEYLDNVTMAYELLIK